MNKDAKKALPYLPSGIRARLASAYSVIAA
jgi:hypothetical protein